MPGTSLIGIVKPQVTPDAPGSIPAVCGLLKRMPWLMMLTLDEASQFGAFITSLGEDIEYEDFMGACIQHCT